MPKDLFTVAEVTDRILAGQRLLLAGDAALLAQLPAGEWIGGTTASFMANHSCVTTRDKFFVSELPPCLTSLTVVSYDSTTISKCYLDAPNNGFSFIIIPAASPTHFAFALQASGFPNFALRPLVGWIAGVPLEEWQRTQPLVFFGPERRALEDGAVVIHAGLPADRVADIGVVNMFELGDGDVITFPDSGFAARESLVNGTPVNFARYLREQQLDTRLPLIAEHGGMMLNVSFVKPQDADDEVGFYAPVFSGIEYRHARPVQNFLEQYIRKTLGAADAKIIIACNCILNHIYSGYNSSDALYTSGPFTFGEIAYQTLNQTMVYLRVVNIPGRG